MTMPSSGALNMGGTSSPVSVAQELGLGLTTTISMNQSDVRSLAGVSGTSGSTWSMNSLYGKSAAVVNIDVLTGTFLSYNDGLLPVTVELSFFTDGDMQMFSTGTTAELFNGGDPDFWVTPQTSTIGNSYWINWTLVGTVGTNGSATGSSGRAQLSTFKTITVIKSGGGTSDYTAEYDIEIWDAASGGTRVGYAPGMTIVASRALPP
jgi:hypothetical protein